MSISYKAGKASGNLMDYDTETARRIQMARDANGCEDWWMVCQAECCKRFGLKGINMKIAFDGVKFTIPLKPGFPDDLKWYYELHGAEINEDSMILNMKDYELEVEDGGDMIIFKRPCKLLDGCKCKGHPDQKPEICKKFDETGKKRCTGIVTRNCLARYRRGGLQWI